MQYSVMLHVLLKEQREDLHYSSKCRFEMLITLQIVIILI